MINNRVRVKICGVTTLEDATAVSLAGADAIGMVFYQPSSRNIDIEMAAKISRSIPAFVNRVALFVDADKNFIEEVLQSVAIDTIQFHGQEPEEACACYNKPYIKALRVKQGLNIDNALKQYESANAILLDTYVKDKPGGTGLAFDWQHFPTNSTRPLILAGGLTPENVQSAIRQTSPYAVDVSGGIELKSGIKDIQKVTKFIREVNNV